MRARVAIALLVACVLTFLQNAVAAGCGPRQAEACCCCAGVATDCPGMDCAAPAGVPDASTITVSAATPSLEIPVPRTVDAPDFELLDTAPRAFAPAPLALASHPPPLSLSCILLI